MCGSWNGFNSKIRIFASWHAGIGLSWNGLFCPAEWQVPSISRCYRQQLCINDQDTSGVTAGIATHAVFGKQLVQKWANWWFYKVKMICKGRQFKTTPNIPIYTTYAQAKLHITRLNITLNTKCLFPCPTPTRYGSPGWAKGWAEPAGHITYLKFGMLAAKYWSEIHDLQRVAPRALIWNNRSVILQRIFIKSGLIVNPTVILATIEVRGIAALHILM